MNIFNSSVNGVSNNLNDNTNNNDKITKYVHYKQLNQPYNECMWDCYNRLDRRYKVYWK